jgi:hypothetical protein
MSTIISYKLQITVGILLKCVITLLVLCPKEIMGMEGFRHLRVDLYILKYIKHFWNGLLLILYPM